MTASLIFTVTPYCIAKFNLLIRKYQLIHDTSSDTLLCTSYHITTTNINGFY